MFLSLCLCSPLPSPAAGTAMTHYSGTAVWDAAGSIGIGLLLGVIATFLVGKNRQLLLGRSMSPEEVAVRGSSCV